MEDEVVNIQGVDVVFFRSHRAKRLNITIKPFVGVRVSVPRSVSFKKARALAEDRISWIKTHLSNDATSRGVDDRLSSGHKIPNQVASFRDEVFRYCKR